jgi:hypothetical protein
MVRPIGAVWVAAVWVAALCAACHRAPQEAHDAGTPGEGASPPPSAALERGPHHATATALPCRAVTLEGDVRPIHGDPFDGGTTEAPVVLQSTLPEDVWLLAGDRARLVAKDPRTTRETTFVGPGRFRPCVGHREESWVGAGRFDSTVGAGESPGAEEWVVTPFAVVRYASAKLQLEVMPKTMNLAIEAGPVFVWPADDAKSDRHDRAPSRGDAAALEDDTDLPWQRVGEGNMHVLSISASAARPAVDTCADRARRAEELTRRIMTTAVEAGASRALSERVAEQVRARRLARAACAVAGVRLALSGESAERRDLEGILRDANARWAAVPLAP